MNDATSIEPGLPFRINLRRVNKVVGYIAFCLPLALFAVSFFTQACFAESISHYYYTRIGGDILVGALTTIGVTLFFFYLIPDGVDGYLRHHGLDMIALRVAGVAAVLIAFVPTTGSGCAFADKTLRSFLLDASGSDHFPIGRPPVTGTISFDFWASFGVTEGILRLTHFGAAVAMFLVLAYFSIVVFRRPQSSRSVDTFGAHTDKKRLRNRWYLILGLAILASIAAIALGKLLLPPDGAAARAWAMYRLTFVFEALALFSFGLSWLIKGRFISYFEDA